jgi:hypothetical protein
MSTRFGGFTARSAALSGDRGFAAGGAWRQLFLAGVMGA